jgi:hypothetical protein
VPKTANLGAKQLGYAVGILLIVTVPLNILMTGHNLVSLFVGQHWGAAITDTTLLLLGVGCLYMTYKLSNVAADVQLASTSLKTEAS